MTQLEKPSKLKRLLGHRMAYGEIIPPDTRVDPAGFPEADFPVFCPQCEYELRGLPEQRCPECGRAFDRGRLLVEQYVRGIPVPERKRVLWYCKWYLVLACFCTVIHIVLDRFLDELDSQAMMLHFELIRYVLIFRVLWAALLLLLPFAILFRAARAVRRRRERVFSALDHDSKEYRSAERFRQILPVILMVALVVAAGLFLIGQDDEWREVLLVPIAEVLVCAGLIIWLRCRKRKDDR